MRLILTSLILCLALFRIRDALENEGDDKEEESVILTVYEVDPDPFTNHTAEENKDSDLEDTTSIPTDNTEDPSTTPGSTR